MGSLVCGAGPMTPILLFTEILFCPIEEPAYRSAPRHEPLDQVRACPELAEGMPSASDSIPIAPSTPMSAGSNATSAPTACATRPSSTTVKRRYEFRLRSSLRPRSHQGLRRTPTGHHTSKISSSTGVRTSYPSSVTTTVFSTPTAPSPGKTTLGSREKTIPTSKE